MTIICSWCKKVIGEKCGKCGSLDIEMATSVGKKKYYKCRSSSVREVKAWDGKMYSARIPCGWFWTPGSEPATDGICDECRVAQQAKNS